MKLNKIIISIIVCLLPVTIALATPSSLNIQGKLTDSSGSLQTGTFNFTFRMYDDFTSGNKLYETNITSDTDSRGIYDIILENINLPFDKQYYLAVKINNDSEMQPRVNLTSVPYSFTSNQSKALNTTRDVFVNDKVNLTSTGNIAAYGNLTLGQKITFSLGEIIDNLVDSFIRVTGNLNVTGTIHADTFTDGNVTITDGTVSADQLDIGGGFSSNGLTIEKDGDIKTVGDILFSGNITVINVTHLSLNGSILPSLDGTFDIGNGSLRWRNANLSGTIHVNKLITTDRLTVNNTFFVNGSRVGIGTNAPQTPLHVNGKVRLNSPGGSDEELHIGPTTGSSDTVISLDNSGNVFELHVQSNDKFRITDSGETANYFTILGANDNVGINTTNPGQTLTIQGTLNITADGTAGPNLMVASGGLVGIGTTSPSNTLEVSGIVKVQGLNITGGAGTTNLTIGNGTIFYNGSGICINSC